jgi:hypothetical protein
MVRMQVERVERVEWAGAGRRSRAPRAVAVDGRFGRGMSVALVGSLPIWAALVYALTG